MIVKAIQQKLMKTVKSSKVKCLSYLGIMMVYSLAMSAHAQGVFPEEENKSAEQVKINLALQYQVKFKARPDHSFLLSADYRFFPDKASAKNMPGVIVLHDCHSQRKNYQSLKLTEL